jgi:GR25 family glycosyltransferase involved in LPS biosynthesis
MKNKNETYLLKVIEPVFVVSLESNFARVQHVKNMLKTISVNAEIVPAVDVGKITRDELKQFIDKGDVAETYYDDLTPGELGCAMSHLSVWRKIVDAGFEQALVLEDDFMFCQNFSEKYYRLKNALPKDFDVTFLYLWLRKQYPVNPLASSPYIGIPSNPYGTVG